MTQLIWYVNVVVLWIGCKLQTCMIYPKFTLNSKYSACMVLVCLIMHSRIATIVSLVRID